MNTLLAHYSIAMNTLFVPKTTDAEHYNNIATPQGRSNLFKKRIEELTKPKDQGGPGFTTDEAVHEMRTSAKSEDVALLAAMGDAPSKVRSEKLQQQKFNDSLTKLADENATATTPSREVAAAMKTATNARTLAFNARIDTLMAEGLTLDQAIRKMQASVTDARLLASMGG